MSTQFKAKIANVGQSVDRFLGEKLLLVFSNADVMSEVKNYSVLITEIDFPGHIEPGQCLCISGECFEITAVGDIAEKNLRTINHVTFKANGAKEAEIPGTIYLEDKAFPEIKQNTWIEIK